MKRRDVITAFGALAGVALTGISRQLLAGQECGPVVYGAQRCEVGIDSSILDVEAADTQHASQWCWAACIQAVFSYYGHDVPQERIVEEAWGQIVNMPGYPNDILKSLNRVWEDEDGKRFKVSGNSYTANPITASKDLALDKPLIIGTMGHAMVLTAMTFDRDGYGNGIVRLAEVRDPWPTNPRHRVLSAQEWFSINFAVRIRVTDLD